jgi:hypothetical protein
MNRRIIPAFFGVFLLVPLFAMAQSLQSLGGTELSISLEPSFPEPNEPVTARIENLLGSRAGASIAWLLDGVAASDSTTSRTLEFTAPAVGESLTVSATLNIPGGGTERVSATVEPMYLDMIIEPQTHTPSFYTGRALPSTGSVVNATALLFGDNTAAQNLVYTWRVNNEVVGGTSVRGGFKTSFEMPADSRVIIGVDVTRLSGELIAQKSEILLNVRPELHFYEDHTLYGLQPLSLDNRFLTGSTVSIVAAPYHLDSRVYNNPDVIEWELNGARVASANANPYQITINPGVAAGGSEVGFRVQSTTQFLQGVQDSTRIFY